MQIRNITGPDHVYPCWSEHSLDQVAGIDPLAVRDRGFNDEHPGLNTAISSSFMIFATVFCVMRIPSARRSAVIRGAP